ncbi:hypothetical protein LUZ60_012148 [Juncus effusus]|nr:hypothetical protein LUZ60_012148 [Juncus effusus]
MGGEMSTQRTVVEEEVEEGFYISAANKFSNEEEEVFYIAVGKKYKEEKANLRWLMENFPGSELVIVHVYRPSSWTKFLDIKVLDAVACQRERNKMLKMLSSYVKICAGRKVTARYVQNENIAVGIEDLVYSNKIKRIAMGSRSMSKRTALLNRCQIWLVRKGKHISTSKAIEEQLTENQTMHEESQEGSRELTRMITSDVSQDNSEEYEADDLEVEQRSKEANDLCTQFEALRLPKCSKQRNILEFTMTEIVKATENYDPKHLLGYGSYGVVYRGQIGKRIVAIKILNPQGKQDRQQFKQEVLALKEVNHPNVVKLIGVCSETSTLVYEYLEKGNLKDNIPTLSWPDRIRIIGELKSALSYLHNHRSHAIIHGDLKPENVLLGENHRSCIGDFGTAKLAPHYGRSIYEETKPIGTIGYMDPVYLMTGKLTPKSDIYALGVIILQLLTGIMDTDTSSQVREAIDKGVMIEKLLDKKAGNWPSKQTVKLIEVALRCCSPYQEQRPSLLSTEDWSPLCELQALKVNS